jgi:hypothetical protein
MDAQPATDTTKDEAIREELVVEGIPEQQLADGDIRYGKQAIKIIRLPC